MPNAVVPIKKIKAVIVMVAKKVQLEKIYRYTNKRGSARIKVEEISVLTITGKHAGRNSNNDWRDEEKEGESDTRLASDAYPTLDRKHDKRIPPDEREYRR